mmetsp:Transcript_13870/g.39859  ORF Transcript_13870/g.39859 Transcript_13870/m.39859 type:complete len:362 (+) Transcript_13870:141-1226(+)
MSARFTARLNVTLLLVMSGVTSARAVSNQVAEFVGTATPSCMSDPPSPMQLFSTESSAGDHRSTRGTTTTPFGVSLRKVAICAWTSPRDVPSSTRTLSTDVASATAEMSASTSAQSRESRHANTTALDLSSDETCLPDHTSSRCDTTEPRSALYVTSIPSTALFSGSNGTLVLPSILSSKEACASSTPLISMFFRSRALRSTGDISMTLETNDEASCAARDAASHDASAVHPRSVKAFMPHRCASSAYSATERSGRSLRSLKTAESSHDPGGFVDERASLACASTRPSTRVLMRGSAVCREGRGVDKAFAAMSSAEGALLAAARASLVSLPAWTCASRARRSAVLPPALTPADLQCARSSA